MGSKLKIFKNYPIFGNTIKLEYINTSTNEREVVGQGPGAPTSLLLKPRNVDHPSFYHSRRLKKAILASTGTARTGKRDKNLGRRCTCLWYVRTMHQIFFRTIGQTSDTKLIGYWKSVFQLSLSFRSNLKFDRHGSHYLSAFQNSAGEVNTGQIATMASAAVLSPPSMLSSLAVRIIVDCP
jgi:hypothetical protein